MYEVCCAVNGVADEGWSGREFGFAFYKGLFANEGICWVCSGKAGRDHSLNCFVGFGYEIGSWMEKYFRSQYSGGEGLRRDEDYFNSLFNLVPELKYDGVADMII